MKLALSVDIISDLNLKNIKDFNWEDKRTSLFCVVAGNLSSDLFIVQEILKKLSKLYRGIFYIDGYLEHPDIEKYSENVKFLKKTCETMSNVVYLHNHVVILNGIAFVACNGWFNEKLKFLSHSVLHYIDDYRVADIGYLTNTIKSLQIHADAKKIIVISSSIPIQELCFSKNEDMFNDKLEPGMALLMDTESKITTWIFGGSDIASDMIINDRHYITNPYSEGQPYWPKRVEI